MIAGWWSGLLLRLYETLTLSNRATPADLIYVMAGKMERKDYGLELYQAGLAPRLVLGVGRFEVTKMRGVSLEHSVVEELIALRNKTPADERHFFVKLDPSGVSIEKRHLRRWSTYGEILDLQDWLKAKNVRRVMVISTDVHLRRVALTLAFHSLEEGLHLSLHCVIDAKCDGGAAGRADHFGCLFNRFRTIVRGAVGTHASSSAIVRRTSFSERPSDATTCAACRAGNDSNGAGK
jgi:hypothetical protein